MADKNAALKLAYKDASNAVNSATGRLAALKAAGPPSMYGSVNNSNRNAHNEEIKKANKAVQDARDRAALFRPATATAAPSAAPSAATAASGTPSRRNRRDRKSRRRSTRRRRN